jgi:hypothetical protein
MLYHEGDFFWEDESDMPDTWGEMRNTHNILVVNLQEKRLIGKPRYRWDNNFTVGLKYGVRVWTDLIWLTIGSSCMFYKDDVNLWVSKKR